MRSACIALASLILIGGVASADEARMTWHHEGHASLRKAAGEAKAKRSRLLLGLSGGAT